LTDRGIYRTQVSKANDCWTGVSHFGHPFVGEPASPSPGN